MFLANRKHCGLCFPSKINHMMANENSGVERLAVVNCATVGNDVFDGASPAGPVGPAGAHTHLEGALSGAVVAPDANDARGTPLDDEALDAWIDEVKNAFFAQKNTRSFEALQRAFFPDTSVEVLRWACNRRKRRLLEQGGVQRKRYKVLGKNQAVQLLQLVDQYTKNGKVQWSIVTPKFNAGFGLGEAFTTQALRGHLKRVKEKTKAKVEAGATEAAEDAHEVEEADVDVDDHTAFQDLEVAVAEDVQAPVEGDVAADVPTAEDLTPAPGLVNVSSDRQALLLADLESRVVGLEAALVEEHAKVLGLDEEKNRLLEAIQVHKSEISALEHQVEELVKTVHQERGCAEEAKGELESVRLEKDELIGAKNELQNQVDAVSSHLLAENKKAKEQEAQVEKLNDAISRLMTTKAGLVKPIEGQATIVKDSENVIAKMKQQLQTQQKDFVNEVAALKRVVQDEAAKLKAVKQDFEAARYAGMILNAIASFDQQLQQIAESHNICGV